MAQVGGGKIVLVDYYHTEHGAFWNTYKWYCGNSGDIMLGQILLRSFILLFWFPHLKICSFNTKIRYYDE